MKGKNRNMDLRKKDSARRFSRKSHETEEAAIIRRFHDAQRMARFRAKRKKALEEEKGFKTVNHLDTSFISELMKRNITLEIVNSIGPVSTVENPRKHVFVQNSAFIIGQSDKSKYSQLLTVIEELGNDIRLTYAGSRSSIERLKMGIVRARTLIKDCLLETEVNPYN